MRISRWWNFAGTTGYYTLFCLIFFSFSQPSSDKYLLTGNLLTRKAFWTQMEVSLEIQSTNYILHSYFAYSHSSTNIIFKINQQLLFSVIKRQFIFVACKKYIWQLARGPTRLRTKYTAQKTIKEHRGAYQGREYCMI